MEIEKLRRLWYLSTVPTHSPASLTELHQLVREASPWLIPSDLVGPCNVCVNQNDCIEHGELAKHCIMDSPRFVNFELRMEGD